MRKRRLKSFARLILSMIVILLIVYLFLETNWMSDTFGRAKPAVESPAQIAQNEIIPTESTDSVIEVYFCPRDDCEGRLFELLDSARGSIHCAAYELNLPRIISLLENKSIEGIDIKVVIDDAYFHEVENFSWVRQDGKQGLMHNKFCVVDSKMVFTGSMNPTKNCAYKNNNNMVVIESRLLSENYEAEFEELWNGEFGKGEKVEYPVIIWNNITIRNYFCPEDGCSRRVREELGKANKSIYFMEFSFTDDYIGKDLVLRFNEGIVVRGVFEKTKISEFSEYQLLDYQGIEVKLDGNKYNMHHKVWIIDNRTVITGSYNPSANADRDNDENILVIEDERVAKRFLEEFGVVWTG
jgi:phosphatidylserine/phosphatidylglycerophosphate/cardiolipin synthase-like enzyme